MAKTCFFIGHRDTTPEIYPSLLTSVEHHIIQYGVTAFFVGHYGSFDRMAAQAVKDAKKRHPDISLLMVLHTTPPFVLLNPLTAMMVPTILGQTNASHHVLRLLKPISAW